MEGCRESDDSRCRTGSKRTTALMIVIGELSRYVLYSSWHSLLIEYDLLSARNFICSHLKVFC